MIKKTLIMMLLGAAICGGSLKAQEGDVMRLSLSEAQQYAIEHNYALQNASLDVRKAEAAKWEALSSMLPQVSAKFDYSNMCGYEMNFSGVSIPMNPNGTFGVTASVALTAQQIMGALMSDISKEMSDITRRQTIQNTYSNVKSVYVSILVMEDVVSLLDSSLANMESLEQSTQASARVGAVEQVEADKLSVQVAQMRNTINSNQRSLQALKNTLIFQMGAPVNSKLELTTTVDEVLNVEAAAQLAMHQFDISKNFDHQMLEKSAELTKEQLTMAWLSFCPTLSVYYQYSDKTYFGKSEGMNMTPPHMVGASVSLPIFESGARMAKIRQAKIGYQEIQNTKSQTEDALQVQFNQNCYDLVNALETYQNQKSNLDVCKRVLKSTTDKYNYGRASNLEVTTASNDIITAQSNYIQAVMSVVQAEMALETLLGENQYEDVVLPYEESK